jgi:hypothetical protein
VTNPCENWHFPVYTQLVADDTVNQEGVTVGQCAVLVEFFDGDEIVYREPVVVDRDSRRIEPHSDGELLTMRGCDPTKYLYVESFVVNHVCGYPGEDNRGA